MTYREDPWEAAGVRPGEILAGKYRVERVLGVGGMGVVVAAHHLQLDERVAIKFLRPEMMRDPEIVGRFAREARAAVKIKSEHVARVADVGALANGAPFMVMEYLEGEDLSAWLQTRGPLPVEQAIDFVLQACVALAEAHALGIVHRDLKPANLYCVQRMDGERGIKVLDFGISKMTDGGTAGSGTRTHALMGSPFYMSPEQMRSAKDVNAQTDIWSLGVIIFELLSGRPAFFGDSVTEVAILVASQPTPSIRALRADASPGLETVLFKCLEKDRRQRYANVAELASALLPFAPARSSASVERIVKIIRAAGLNAPLPGSPALSPRPSTPATDPKVGTLLAPETVVPVGRTTAGTSGRKAAITGAAAGALLLLCLLGAAAVGLLVLLGRRGAHPEVTQAASPSASSPSPEAEKLFPHPSPTAPSPAPAAPESPDPASANQAEASAPLLPKAAVTAPSPIAAPTKPVPPPIAPATATATHAAAHPAVPPPSSGPNRCDPPYYFDEKGNRLFKKDCL